jgi:hypothetical protein
MPKEIDDGDIQDGMIFLFFFFFNLRPFSVPAIVLILR